MKWTNTIPNRLAKDVGKSRRATCKHRWPIYLLKEYDLDGNQMPPMPLPFQYSISNNKFTSHRYWHVLPRAVNTCRHVRTSVFHTEGLTCHFNRSILRESPKKRELSLTQLSNIKVIVRAIGAFEKNSFKILSFNGKTLVLEDYVVSYLAKVLD